MPPSADILERLDAADWKNIYPALVAYVIYLKKEYTRLPNGMEPEDVVDEAICLVFEGRRKWNPRKDPDLKKYLAYSVIPSLINNAFRSAEHARRKKIGPIDRDAYPGFLHDPLALAASADCEKTCRTILKRAMAGDERLLVILEGLLDELSPAEIARELDITVDTVYTLIRKLHRRVRAAMARHECW